MKNVFVDPIIFLTPPSNANKQEVSEWIEQLKSWLYEVSCSPYQWFHCAAILLKYGGYAQLPNIQTLRMWQRKYQMDIDIHNIVNAFTSFFLQESFSLSKTLDRELLNQGYVAEMYPAMTTISPHQYVERWPEPIRDEISSVLALTGVSKSKQIPCACDLSIATLALSVAEKELVVEGEASFLTEYEEHYTQLFSEIFALLYSPQDMEPLDVVELWKQGEQGTRRAIEYQWMKYWSHTASQPLAFSFGPQFFSSLRQHGLEMNHVVLNKIVRFAAATIADTIKDLNCDLHPLYEHDPPNSPQRTRASDGAKAWRLELVTKGVGWRMHYWRISEAQETRIEFARILKKHDPEDIE